jgi:hypothetical protein
MSMSLEQAVGAGAPVVGAGPANAMSSAPAAVACAESFSAESWNCRARCQNGKAPALAVAAGNALRLIESARTAGFSRWLRPSVLEAPARL